MINGDMTFKKPVASASKRGNKTPRLIKRNFEYINKYAFEMLYGTLVKPQLEYALHLYLPYQIGLREKLEHSKKKSHKIC